MTEPPEETYRGQRDPVQLMTLGRVPTKAGSDSADAIFKASEAALTELFKDSAQTPRPRQNRAMNTTNCEKCGEPMQRQSWNVEMCRECSRMVKDPSARPPCLDGERHEHPVFQDTSQGASHALARELWTYAKALESKVLRLEHQMELLERMVRQ